MIKTKTNEIKNIDDNQTFYEYRYYYNNTEIAFYNDKDNIIYLNSDCLSSNIDSPYIVGALAGDYGLIYEVLFDKLNILPFNSIAEYQVSEN